MEELWPEMEMPESLGADGPSVLEKKVQAGMCPYCGKQCGVIGYHRRAREDFPLDPDRFGALRRRRGF